MLAYRLKENVPLIKLIKINHALFVTQIKEFYKEKFIFYIILSTFVFLLKNLMILFPLIKIYKNKSINLEDKLNWEKLIR